jgi:hypothetical protein
MIEIFPLTVPATWVWHQSETSAASKVPLRNVRLTWILFRQNKVTQNSNSWET